MYNYFLVFDKLVSFNGKLLKKDMNANGHLLLLLFLIVILPKNILVSFNDKPSVSFGVLAETFNNLLYRKVFCLKPNLPIICCSGPKSTKDYLIIKRGINKKCLVPNCKKKCAAFNKKVCTNKRSKNSCHSKADSGEQIKFQNTFNKKRSLKNKTKHLPNYDNGQENRFQQDSSKSPKVLAVSQVKFLINHTNNNTTEISLTNSRCKKNNKQSNTPIEDVQKSLPKYVAEFLQLCKLIMNIGNDTEESSNSSLEMFKNGENEEKVNFENASSENSNCEVVNNYACKEKQTSPSLDSDESNFFDLTATNYHPDSLLHNKKNGLRQKEISKNKYWQDIERLLQLSSQKTTDLPIILLPNVPYLEEVGPKSKIKIDQPLIYKPNSGKNIRNSYIITEFPFLKLDSNLESYSTDRSEYPFPSYETATSTFTPQKQSTILSIIINFPSSLQKNSTYVCFTTPENVIKQSEFSDIFDITSPANYFSSTSAETETITSYNVVSTATAKTYPISSNKCDDITSTPPPTSETCSTVDVCATTFAPEPSFTTKGCISKYPLTTTSETHSTINVRTATCPSPTTTETRTTTKNTTETFSSTEEFIITTSTNETSSTSNICSSTSTAETYSTNVNCKADYSVTSISKTCPTEVGCTTCPTTTVISSKEPIETTTLQTELPSTETASSPTTFCGSMTTNNENNNTCTNYETKQPTRFTNTKKICSTIFPQLTTTEIVSSSTFYKKRTTKKFCKLSSATTTKKNSIKKLKEKSLLSSIAQLVTRRRKPSGENEYFQIGLADSIFLTPFDNQTTVEDYIRYLNKKTEIIYKKYRKAMWDYETNITHQTRKKSMVTSLEVTQYQRNLNEALQPLKSLAIGDSNLERQIKLLYLPGMAILPDYKITEFEQVLYAMQTIYNAASVSEWQTPSHRVYLEPVISNRMASSHDNDELKYYWTEWRKATGRRIRSLYEQYVELMNTTAISNGFADAGEMWTRRYETEDFMQLMGSHWEDMRPLYNELHAYVRHELHQKYGEISNAKDTGTIPVHLTGDIWGKDWKNLYNLVAPYSEESNFMDMELVEKENGPPRLMPSVNNVVPTFRQAKAKRFSVKRMVVEAEKMFHSLGFPKLPQSFWSKSVFVKSNFSEMNCEPSVWDMLDSSDYRIKLCGKTNMENFFKVHELLAKVEYFIQYQNLSFPFRDTANPSFGDAIAEALVLSAKSRRHLEIINLLPKQRIDSEKTDMNFLMRMALEKVASLPYSYVLDLWRHRVFQGDISSSEYNKKWWELRIQYQGVSPPGVRTEEDFDIGSKFEVAANKPYLKNFLSTLMEFQIHDSLCAEAGHKGDLFNCDITSSSKAGKKLRKVMSMGATQHWRIAMKILTGERRLQSGSLIKYFQPLHKWLKNKNKETKQRVGWQTT